MIDNLPNLITIFFGAIAFLFIVEGIFGRRSAYECSTLFHVVGMALMAYGVLS